MEVMVMGKLLNVVHDLRAIFMMILIQIMSAGMVIIYKVASEYDMSMKVLVAYRYMFASATLVPLAFFIERRTRPKLTWMIVLQAFSSAFFAGTLAQNMYAESLVLTSATFATAMFNLVPAITFIMAIFFRIEKLGLNSSAGKAKVVGTLTSIIGAMILTIYKGVEIKLWSTKINLLHQSNEHQGHVAASHQYVNHHNPLLGTLLIVISCFSSSFSLIIQSKMSVQYPCYYSSTALICFFGAFQTLIYALCFERNWSKWKFGWDMRLLAYVYAGVVASGLASCISMWCVRLKGPLFVSIFNPLMLVIVAVASSLFLEEKLWLGSVIGASIIICGLYIVIWGKSKEMKRLKQLIPSKSIEETKLGGCNVTTPAKVEETKSIHPIDLLGLGLNVIPPSNLASEDDENKEIVCEIETVGR